MPLVCIIQPAAPPLSVAELRAHVRQDITADDPLLDVYLRAAREFAQNWCRRTLVACRYKLVLDSFPGSDLVGVPYGVPYSLPGQAVLLEYGPVLAVQSIKYLDMSATQQTLSPSVYTAELSGLPARVTPRFGQIWPPTLPQIGAIEIVFDAGDCAPLSASGNIINITGGIWKALALNDALRLVNSGGALPTPLQPDTDYYVQSLPSSTSFTLAASSGGAVIPLTDAGTGQSYVGAIPESVRSWLLLRAASLFENREDVAILQRATLIELPFMDRLLDGATVYLN